MVSDLCPCSLAALGFVAAVEQLFASFEARTGVACVREIDPPDLALDGERAVAV